MTDQVRAGTMAPRYFRSNWRLWAVFACALFVVFGFLDPMDGAGKADHSFWSLVGILGRGVDIRNTDEMALPAADLLLPIVFQAGCQAVLACALGWVDQALVVVVLSSDEPRTEKSEP